MVKNCDLSLENAALGLRPRAAFSRPRQVQNRGATQRLQDYLSSEITNSKGITAD